MKRFLILKYYESDGICLEDSVIGTCDDLEDAQFRFNYYDDYQALDLKSGDMWQGIDEGGGWTKFGNLKDYPVFEKEPEAKQCALEGCENMFPTNNRGSERKYCKVSHKVRAYQLRKAASLA